MIFPLSFQAFRALVPACFSRDFSDDSSHPPKTVAHSSIDPKRAHSCQFSRWEWATRCIQAQAIRQALGDALAAGRDHLAQTEFAVQAVLQVRPDMTSSGALAAVNLVRRE
jgi:hypothetical protein